ncbi:hypothetical protein [Piscinibacter sp. HJYY11]|uniref:hypothetical protein n=1 Tax=Piscinibacter sp. HJYY11 TaxID=2801333 RepID=UPI00191F74F9|nr:hypothetical protein [Piscinibacter sp. HJYY11]MBL0731202.1 hypothetical protein [Piscinibacter sp. HJYY11]
MRRNILSVFALAGLSFAGGSALASKPQRRIDKRLLGTWKSDKERTIERWRYERPLDSVQREKFESIFGKLVLRVTETHYYGTFDEDKFSGQYTVLASDERSVCISHKLAGTQELKQYFFEGNHMYVLVGYNIEFFKRVEA